MRPCRAERDSRGPFARAPKRRGVFRSPLPHPCSRAPLLSARTSFQDKQKAAEDAPHLDIRSLALGETRHRAADLLVDALHHLQHPCLGVTSNNLLLFSGFITLFTRENGLEPLFHINSIANDENRAKELPRLSTSPHAITSENFHRRRISNATTLLYRSMSIK